MFLFFQLSELCLGIVDVYIVKWWLYCSSPSGSHLSIGRFEMINRSLQIRNVTPLKNVTNVNLFSLILIFTSHFRNCLHKLVCNLIVLSFYLRRTCMSAGSRQTSIRKNKKKRQQLKVPTTIVFFRKTFQVLSIVAESREIPFNILLPCRK